MLARHGRRVQFAALLAALSGCCHLASGRYARVEQIHVLPAYTGPLLVEGWAWAQVTDQESDDSIDMITFQLVGTDPECNDSIRVRNACSIAVYEDMACEGVASRPAQAAPWEEAQYRTIDGKASGEIPFSVGITNFDMVDHALVVTDASATPVACGILESKCMSIMGLCFYEWMLFITGMATIAAVLDSFWLINQHCELNRNPALRMYAIRILLMVPVYSLQSFVALWLKVQPITAELFRFSRELYESIVIFSFLQFILACVGGAAAVVRRFDGAKAAQSGLEAVEDSLEVTPGGAGATDPRGEELNGECEAANDIRQAVHRVALRHICPWHWFCPPWQSAQQMLQWCVRGALVYVIVGILVPIVALACAVVAPESHVREKIMSVGNMAFMVANMIAVNSLFELANVFMHDLEDLKPIAKFASVKLVVFFTFWQGILLRVLVRRGVFKAFLDPSHMWISQEQISGAFQHGLLCIEMLMAAVFHHVAFPPEDYKVVQQMRLRRVRTFRKELTLDNVFNVRSVKRRFEVVDFRDIFMIARYGIVQPHFGRTKDLASDSEAHAAESSDGSSVDDAELDEGGSLEDSSHSDERVTDREDTPRAHHLAPSAALPRR